MDAIKKIHLKTHILLRFDPLIGLACCANTTISQALNHVLKIAKQDRPRPPLRIDAGGRRRWTSSSQKKQSTPSSGFLFLLREFLLGDPRTEVPAYDATSKPIDLDDRLAAIEDEKEIPLETGQAIQSVCFTDDRTPQRSWARTIPSAG